MTGTGLFLRSPALGRWNAAPAAPSAGAADGAPAAAGAGRAILAVALAAGAAGLCLGGLGLVIVAFSQARHDPAAVAWIEAALAARSAASATGRSRGGYRRSTASFC